MRFATATGRAAAPDGLDLSPPGTVKYMGSKRSLVPVLAPHLAALCEPGATILDLFAGTQVVGYAMRRRNRVIAVDSQGYSRVLGAALLRDRIEDSSGAQVIRRLQPHIERHASVVGELYRRPLATERRLVDALLARDVDDKVVDDYASFQGRFPNPASWMQGSPLPRRGSFGRHLRELVDVRRSRPREFPYLLMTAYYANAYFGLAQAMTLDALRYAIDEEFGDGPGRDLCLAALLSAASNCTSTPGHFAMWRVIRTVSGARDIARFRVRDPLLYFKTKLDELMAMPPHGLHKHEFVTGDAVSFVRSYDGSVGVAYVDPPYSPVHYSRFYHVLEELVDYDYPAVFFGGRFPADRYVSAWSVRSQAAEAFGSLLHVLAERRWPTVISYGASGVVSEATLVRLCQRAFGNAGVELQRVVTRHASMGRADRGARPTRELLVTCRTMRRRSPSAAAYMVAPRPLDASP